MILIIAAMQEEYDELFKLITNPILEETNGIQSSRGILNGKEVILIQSGVGKVNASYATTSIINKYPISFIINIGSAGGLTYNYELDVLDIVLGDKVCYHDVDITAAGRPFGQIGGLPLYFESAINDEMIKSLDSINLKYHIGTIATGDQFINNNDKFSWINDNFANVLAVEMEGAAIAHIAHLNNIPFLIVRSISDVMNDNDNGIQFDEYIKKASVQSAKACFALVNTI